MTKDMTNGSPMKLILGFSIPLLFGYLFQQFYNLVDTLIVGRFLGVDALAAVGSTGSLNFLIIGFCMGVCNGFAIPLAHKFGAGDYRGLRAFMVNAIYLSAIFAVVMTAVTVVFCRPILELMRTPDNIIDGAYLYIVIIFAGIPATYLYNLISAIHPFDGRQQDPRRVFGNLICDEYCVRPCIYHKSSSGCSWRITCNGDLSGSVRNRMPDLQLEKI